MIKDKYKKEISKNHKKSKVIAIIRAVENVRTFTNKEITTKKGSKFTKMYSVNKFVSQYYIYIDDEQLGLCYLKISSYLPFVSEFYFNGHNYLKKQFDLRGKKYKMKENSFTQVEDLELLKTLVEDFQPSIALKRISHWVSIFFKFDKGKKSTRSKLLSHSWFTYQTEIASNIIFKSAKFANKFFNNVLSKHHTIGLPDRLTEIFSLKEQKNSKTTQNKYKTKAVIKHWLEGNSIKCYNKSGCLLRVETTINKPELPGLKLKKPAVNLMAYYWYGHACNSRYFETISDIDVSVFKEGIFSKYQGTITTEKGKKVAAPDLRKEHQVDLLKVLLQSSNRVFGFRNKDLREQLGTNWKPAKIAYEMRKLRERGAVKKIKNTHYYRLTKEGYNWILCKFFNSEHLIKPLISVNCNNDNFEYCGNRSTIEDAYFNINKEINNIMQEFGLVA